jgi:hypothetical protein
MATPGSISFIEQQIRKMCNQLWALVVIKVVINKGYVNATIALRGYPWQLSICSIQVSMQGEQELQNATSISELTRTPCTGGNMR